MIRRSRGQALKWTGISLVFVGAGVYVLTLAELADTVVGAACLLLGLGGVIVLGPDLIRPRDLVRIGPTGFEQRVSFPRGFIPWSAVGEISVLDRGRRVRWVRIAVSDPRSFIGRGRRLWRAEQRGRWTLLAKVMLAVARSDLKSHGIEIPATLGFPITADELAQQLHRAQNQYTHGRTPGMPR